jgi:hypothetical protein
MKRPIGVILSSIVLGLFAALQLLFAALVGLGGAFLHHAPPPPAAYPPGMTPPPANFLTILLAAYAVFLVLLATWAIVTLVGLVRLRNWARYSVLVIGGCMAALGLLSVVGMIFAMTILPSLPQPPNVPAHTMQAAFLFDGVIFAVVTAIGVWWLVYFNLRSTKVFFVPAYPPGFEPAYVLDPATFPAMPPPPYAPPSSYPPRGPLQRVPTAVIVLACLFLFGGITCAGCLFLPYPAFVAGFTLSSAASHVLYIVLGLISIAVAAGLFRLDNRFRIATFVLLALGSANVLLLLTPWCRARLTAYTGRLYESLHMGYMVQPAQTMFTGPLMVFAVLFSLSIYGVIAWILHRYRAAFTTRTTAVQP